MILISSNAVTETITAFVVCGIIDLVPKIYRRVEWMRLDTPKDMKEYFGFGGSAIKGIFNK